MSPFDLLVENLGSILLNINKAPPGFPMAGKPLHEGRVTVPASMATAHIRIDAIINPGNSRFGKHSLNVYFPDG
jgi:hypothetical protein